MLAGLHSHQWMDHAEPPPSVVPDSGSSFAKLSLALILVIMQTLWSVGDVRH